MTTLDNLDLKEVIQFVCDKFPTDKTLELANVRDTFVVSGYVVETCDAEIAFSEKLQGLRYFVKKMQRLQ